jgi:transcriptional regulator with XRE-family HTH domain
VDTGIGARVRRARQARKPKMTLAQLAGTRLSISLVSKIERGHVWPSLPTLGYLAERLELPVASLLESDDVPLENPSVSPFEPRAGSLDRAEAYLGLGEPEAALALLDEQTDASPVQSAPVTALRALALLASGRLDEAVAAAQAIEFETTGAAEDWPSSRQGRSRPEGDLRDGRDESTASNWQGSGQAKGSGMAQRPEPARGDRRSQGPRQAQGPAPTDGQTISDDEFARARAAFVVGEVARQRGRDALAIDGFRRCLRAPGDDVRWLDLRARALRALAALHDDRGDAETARNLYRQAAVLLAQTTHPRQRAARWLRLSESLERAGNRVGAGLAAARAAELAALLEDEVIRLDVDARLGRLAVVTVAREGQSPRPRY